MRRWFHYAPSRPRVRAWWARLRQPRGLNTPRAHYGATLCLWASKGRTSKEPRVLRKHIDAVDYYENIKRRRALRPSEKAKRALAWQRIRKYFKVRPY